MSDVERQIKIIEFLGFNVLKIDEGINYKITDAVENEVGYIKYIQDDNHYYVKIDNDEIRVESGVNDVDFPSSPLNLEIFFKQKCQDCFIHMGDDCSIIKMHLPGNKMVILLIGREQFFMGCKEPYGSYLQQEVSVNSVQRSYTYNFSCLDIRDEKNGYPLYIGELKCQPLIENGDLLEIRNTWDYWCGIEHNNKKPNYISTVTGDVEDAIMKHQMGIKVFNRMRFLMNTVPFKSEIINFVVENTKFDLPGYIDLFIPEVKSNKKFKNLIKNN